MLTPTGNGFHLRMGRRADDDGLPTGFLRVGNQAMDALDRGTGGINDLNIHLLQGFIDPA